MNFLSLVQRLAQEAGAAGAPASVSGQVGEHKRLVDWTRLSWETIQSIHTDWHFLRGSFSFTTVADQASYTPVEAGIATRFGAWDTDWIKCYKTSDGAANEKKLDVMDYSEYRDRFLLGTIAADHPTRFCVLPTRGIALGPKPDDSGYTISGDYFKSPQILTANADIPECPEQYHEVIVWRALMFYARYESAPEIYTDAANNYNLRLVELASDQRQNMVTETFA